MKSNTRSLIIDTASELFYEKGYNLTGINEIIAEAGIAKATLYSHFRSKEDLAVAYLEQKDQSMLEELKAYCLAKPAGNERIKAIVEFLLPFYHSEGFNGCWCIRTAAEIPRDNVKIRTTIQVNKNLFLNFIQSLVQENKPQQSEAAQQKLARKIYLIYEGAVTESHLHQSEWPIHESLEIIDVLLKE